MKLTSEIGIFHTDADLLKITNDINDYVGLRRFFKAAYEYNIKKELDERYKKDNRQILMSL